MISDPIADMLTIIRNGYKSSKEQVSIPYSRLKKDLAEKLIDLGYISSAAEATEDGKKFIKLELKYEKGRPELQGVKRISKPGLRVYKNKKEIPYVLGGLGSAIISTNQGLLSDREARKKQVGGEIICEVW